MEKEKEQLLADYKKSGSSADKWLYKETQRDIFEYQIKLDEKNEKILGIINNDPIYMPSDELKYEPPKLPADLKHDIISRNYKLREHYFKIGEKNGIEILNRTILSLCCKVDAWGNGVECRAYQALCINDPDDDGEDDLNKKQLIQLVRMNNIKGRSKATSVRDLVKLLMSI
jgi:hypothetical protein